MPLTQFETDSITRAVIALERIADVLGSIRDKMPEDAPSLTEADACDFPCDRKPKEPEIPPCYLLDERDNIQPCIRKDGDCAKCPRT